MQALSWSSIGFYCGFSIFVFYQQLHARNFRGASQGFLSLLTISYALGTITGLVYLIYYGWVVSWWAPFVIVVIGLLATVPGFLLERMLGAFALSFIAFIGWPTCAYFMFSLIPKK